MMNKIHTKIIKPRITPQALDLEESILGALLLEKDALAEVIGLLRPDSFYDDRHQAIYEAVLGLFSASLPVDVRTVINQLRKDGRLEKVGGPAYVAQLTNGVASAAHIVTHAHIVLEYALRRQMIQIGKEMQDRALEDSNETFATLNRAEQSLFELSEQSFKNTPQQAHEWLGNSLKELEKTLSGDRSHLLRTGYLNLDRMLNKGLDRQSLVIVGARPGMGKTTFLLNLAAKMAFDHEQPVAFFSLEMATLKLASRILALRTGIQEEKIKLGNLAEEEVERIYEAGKKFSDKKLIIDETPHIGLFELRAKLRKIKAKYGLKAAFIDYLQLMDSGLKGTPNREEQIGKISEGLKSICKELDIIIIAAAQLNRSVESRGLKRPMLADLRESGRIEQDADLATLLYRPEYYGITEDENGNSTQGLAELIIAKNRHGKTGTTNFKYQPSIFRFAAFEPLTQ